MIDVSKLSATETDPASLAAQLRIKSGLGYDYKAPQSQMVGNVFVGANPMQHLAEAIRGIQAGKDVYEGTKELQDIQSQRQAKAAQDMSQYINLLRGTPEKRTEVPQQVMVAGDGANDGEMSQGHVTQVTPAIAPNPTAAEALALGGTNPMLKQLALSRIEKEPEIQARLQQAQQHNETMRAIAEGNQAIRQAALVNRPERQAQIIQTDQGPMQLINGQAVPIVGAGGQQVKGVTTDKPPTEFQGKSGTFGTRAQNAHDTLVDLEGKYNPLAVNTNTKGGTLTNWAMSPEVQKATQAQRDFVNAVLRQESGASISKSEFDNAQKQYFPQPGDTPQVLEQKRQNRELAIQGFERSAGPAGVDVRNIREQNANRRKEQNSKTKPAANPQDAAALQWAQQNPNDPRSAQILQRLGGK